MLFVCERGRSRRQPSAIRCERSEQSNTERAIKHGITLTSMPQLDERFLALPLRALSDAALSKAKELGCSHAEVRVERLRQAYRSFRDHVLETTADGQVLGLSVRVVHNGVWGFASDITPLHRLGCALGGARGGHSEGVPPADVRLCRVGR